jgi:hypothetical protein
MVTFLEVSTLSFAGCFNSQKAFMKHNIITNLKSNTNNIKTEFFNFAHIEKFFTKADTHDAFQVISDRTFKDLDLEDVFRFIDRTSSRVGQQYLYYLLRCIPANNQRSDRLEERINAFQQNPALRASVTNEFSKLSERGAYHVSSLFHGKHIERPGWHWLIQILSGISVLTIILSVFFPQMWVLLILLFPINMGIHYWNKNHIYQYSNSIPQLLLMNQIARKVLANAGFSHLTKVAGSVDSLRKLVPQMSIFKIEAKLQSEIGQVVDYFLELIKALLLLEPIALFAILKKLDARRDDLARVYKFIGETDSALSILALRESLPYYCRPTCDIKINEMNINGIYHPLLFKGVPNDIALKGKSALLTGSNMSGKTTFIRTVGISAILGQTLNTCFARKFAMPLMQVQSSIRISDDLLEEKSYYMEEVLTLKQLIDESNGTKRTLILLDELFKGTNSIERIAMSKSVLSYLARNGNLVFVATHDRELADLLSEHYELYHFTEIIEAEQIVFDYKIKAGVLKTTNAIRILDLNHFPSEIIGEAIRLASRP